eukprot:1000239-Prorocentrum_minimum.AAC.1
MAYSSAPPAIGSLKGHASPPLPRLAPRNGIFLRPSRGWLPGPAYSSAPPAIGSPKGQHAPAPLPRLAPRPGIFLRPARDSSSPLWIGWSPGRGPGRGARPSSGSGSACAA